MIDNEYKWFCLYESHRPEVPYGNVVAKSKIDAVRVFNLEYTLGIFITNLVVVELPNKVSKKYINRYHSLFDKNIFLKTDLPLTKEHIKEIKNWQSN